MRLRNTPLRFGRPTGRIVRFERFLIAMPILALAAQMLLVSPVALAATVYPNPPNATPVAWPSTFSSYTTDTGAVIADTENESGIGNTYDISSANGTASS